MAVKLEASKLNNFKLNTWLSTCLASHGWRTKESRANIWKLRKWCSFCPGIQKLTYFLSLQVFHCHFNSNFFPLFLDKLLGDSITPQTGAILLGVSFVAPHINNLYFLSLCRRFGVYFVIKWLFYVKLGLSVIMLMCGPNWPVLLCFYIAR